jgi:hypothetical protein
LHPAARTFYAREQSSAGTLIGKLSAVDTDKEDKISFEIIGKTFCLVVLKLNVAMNTEIMNTDQLFVYFTLYFKLNSFF